jgi:hypothetical protein
MTRTLNRRCMRMIWLFLCAAPACLAADCEAKDLSTKAVYIEHLGDQDKPFYPIVIAAARPSPEELHCASTDKLSPRVYLVKAQELAETIKILKAHASTDRSGNPVQQGLRCIIVSKKGTLATEIFDLVPSREVISELTAYFTGKQPKLSIALDSWNRRLRPANS